MNLKLMKAFFAALLKGEHSSFRVLSGSEEREHWRYIFEENGYMVVSKGKNEIIVDSEHYDTFEEFEIAMETTCG